MITEDLATLVADAVRAARDAGEFALADDNFAVTMETPANKQHGDFSSNIALALKKSTGVGNSRDLADRILRHLPADNPLIERVDVAGPGFMNFYLKPTWLQDTLVEIETRGEKYGTGSSRQGERTLIEFVSANPTGPINVVNGRAAALGDVLGSLLQAQGAFVGREFYINDALNSLQLEKFTQTVFVRYLQQLGYTVEMPEGEGRGKREEDKEATLPASPSPAKQVVPFPQDGYRGEYVRDIARQIVDQVGNRFETAVVGMLGLDTAGLPATHITPDEATGFFRQATLQGMVGAQREALLAFGLEFDTWFYESGLYQAGTVNATIRTLSERGHTYTQDGALWLRSSELGDDKDRVLVRSNEKATYIAADAAYHHDKFLRGFNRLINIWGADHHGYVARLKAGVAALGHDPQQLEIVLTQMVSLVRDGEAVIGGKRQGNVIELKEDLIDDIGKDAARFYFLLNSYETPATVDVELAKRQDKDNPVYYVQYAHARLCSILRKAREEGIEIAAAQDAARAQLTQPSELAVLRKLNDYPAEVRVATDKIAPHRLTHYAMDMASLLNVFYENCQVLPRGDKPVEMPLCLARLALVNGARIVLSNLLGLLGVSAPQEM